MSSATPSRPAQFNWLVAALVALALAGVLVVAAVVWFFASGAAAAFGAWMYASALGAFVRYALESLLLLVCILLSTAALIYAERKIWGSIPRPSSLTNRRRLGSQYRSSTSTFAAPECLKALTMASRPMR